MFAIPILIAIIALIALAIRLVLFGVVLALSATQFGVKTAGNVASHANKLADKKRKKNHNASTRKRGLNLSKTANKATAIGIVAGRKAVNGILGALKLIARALNFLIGLLLAVLGVSLVVQVLITSAIVASVGSVLFFFVDEKPNFVSSQTPQSGTVQVQQPATPGVVSGAVPAPAGMDASDWATADEIGQRSASWAIHAINNPLPPKSHLVYDQGNTGVGVFDCMVFVTAGVAQNGMDMWGGPWGGVFDYTKHKKSDLPYPGATKSYYNKMKQTGQGVIGDTNTANWKTILKPGDFMIRDGHILFYIGRNTAGTQMIAHASGWGAKYGSADVLGKTPGKDVLFTPLDGYFKNDSRHYLIIRPSALKQF